MKGVFAGDSGDSDEDRPDEVRGVSHLIDDDEQEQSDVDNNDSDSDNDDENSIQSGSQNNSDKEFDGDDDSKDNEDVGIEEDEDDKNGADEEEESENQDDMIEDEEEGSDNENDDSEGDSEGDEGEINEDSVSHTYQPSKGEDIYGRPTGDDNEQKKEGGKYVPPAKRAQLLATIDESSEKVKIVRRQMNGLMNRLSDQSKDSVVRAVKTVFDANSLSVANTILKDCVMAACSNPSQVYKIILF
jgi:hypothetical protein